jgi:hypothetical protein
MAFESFEERYARLMKEREEEQLKSQLKQIKLVKTITVHLINLSMRIFCQIQI